MSKNNLPVFPLNLVLLPGMISSLQIFEPRYIQMVKDCMKYEHGFLISLSQGESKNISFDFSEKCTYVEIIDFNNLPNGLLGITVKSQFRAIISEVYQNKFGLNLAKVKPIIDPEVDHQTVFAEYPEMQDILKQLIKHPGISKLGIEVDFNSADSVSYHLASLIPITMSQKQLILEAFDASQRMTLLSKFLKNFSN